MCQPTEWPLRMTFKGTRTRDTSIIVVFLSWPVVKNACTLSLVAALVEGGNMFF